MTPCVCNSSVGVVCMMHYDIDAYIIKRALTQNDVCAEPYNDAGITGNSLTGFMNFPGWLQTRIAVRLDFGTDDYSRITEAHAWVDRNDAIQVSLEIVGEQKTQLFSFDKPGATQ